METNLENIDFEKASLTKDDVVSQLSSAFGISDEEVRGNIPFLTTDTEHATYMFERPSALFTPQSRASMALVLHSKHGATCIYPEENGTGFQATTYRPENIKVTGIVEERGAPGVRVSTLPEGPTPFPGAKEKVQCSYKGEEWIIGLYESGKDGKRKMLVATSGHRLVLDDEGHYREKDLDTDLGTDLQKAVQKLLDSKLKNT